MPAHFSIPCSNESKHISETSWFKGLDILVRDLHVFELRYEKNSLNKCSKKSCF